jgi:cytochrome c oxidase subunit 1
MKNFWAIFIWGVVIFGVGTFLDKVRTMLISGESPAVMSVFRFAAGFALVVIVVLVQRWLQKWMKDGMAPTAWWCAGALAWGLQAGYGRWVERRRPVDIQTHDTIFVVDYYHVGLGVAVLLLAIAAMYYSYSVVTRRTLRTVLGHIHFWLTFSALYVVLWLPSYYTYTGMEKQLTYLEFQEVNWAYRCMAILLAAAQLLFVFNMVYSLLRKRRRSRRRRSRSGSRGTNI